MYVTYIPIKVTKGARRTFVLKPHYHLQIMIIGIHLLHKNVTFFLVLIKLDRNKAIGD